MLTINTAFMTANLALRSADGRVATRTIDAKSKHSENVLKTIDEMREELGVDILDVQTVAVVVGPGSFTGLRIGVSIAKALGAVNKNLKFIAVSSLELIASVAKEQNLVSGEFVCVLNGLSNLFFVAKFDKDGIKIEEERMIDLKTYRNIKCKKVFLSGDLDEEEGDRVEISSEALLRFALAKEKAGEFVEIDQLMPMYLRLSQAEDNLIAKAKKI